MSKIVKWSLVGLLGILVVAQFIRPTQENPPVIAEQDFINIAQPSAEVASLMKSACYDCHSHETEYPWYASITPVNWWLDDHIQEGRSHFNFSTWGTYNAKKADHKLEEFIEMVEDGEMPLNSYTWTHLDARLSAEQKTMLTTWVKNYRSAMQTAGTSAEGSESEEH